MQTWTTSISSEATSSSALSKARSAPSSAARGGGALRAWRRRRRRAGRPASRADAGVDAADEAGADDADAQLRRAADGLDEPPSTAIELSLSIAANLFHFCLSVKQKLAVDMQKSEFPVLKRIFCVLDKPKSR